MSLDGKTVLITGAALRIGRSLALAVAGAGGDLVIHYGKSRIEAESLAAEIKAMGRRALVLQADLADPAQATALIARAREQGPLFALVNNASVFEAFGWRDTGPAEWNRAMAVNLTAPFLLSREFGVALEEPREGRIVNLIGWRALRPGTDHLANTIGNAALAALTRSLAQALAPRIAVNALALGSVLPPSDGGKAELDPSLVPAGRWADLAEVGQALLFLLDGPAYVTGEIVHVDGGRHLV